MKSKKMLILFVMAAVFAMFGSVFFVPVHAQDEIKLTSEENETLRADQVDLLKAQGILKQSTDEANNAGTQFKSAQEKINTDIEKILKSHGVSSKTHTVCDGPGTGPCAGVKERKLIVVKLPKEEKNEEKK